jgi:hypothetical protein
MKKPKAPPIVVFLLLAFFAAGVTFGLLLPPVVQCPPVSSDCVSETVFFSHPDTISDRISLDPVSFNLAISHIMATESFSPDIYTENNHLFIGYGHMIRQGESFSPPISQQQALDLLIDDFNKHMIPAASRYHLFGNQALAIGMMAYNRGVTATCSGCIDELLSLYKNDPLIAQSPAWCNDLKNCWSSFVMFNGKPHRLLIARRQFELSMFFSNQFFHYDRTLVKF